MNQNEEWKWTDETKTAWKSMVSDNEYQERMATTIIQTGDGMPYAVDESFWEKQTTETDLYTRPLRNRQMRNGKLGYPNVYFDSKTLKEVSDLAADINSYINRYIAAFISRDASVKSWEDFKKFNRLKVDRYMEILQAAYNDYKV